MNSVGVVFILLLFYITTSGSRDDVRCSQSSGHNSGAEDKCLNDHFHSAPIILNQITVREPLHSYLTSLSHTAFKAAAEDITKIVFDLESQSGSKLSNIIAADASKFFTNLITPTDNAFELLAARISNITSAEVPVIVSTSDIFSEYLNNMKWSVHELYDTVALNSNSPLTGSSIRAIEDTAMNVAFGLLKFLSTALELIENIFASVKNENLIGRLLIDFFGVFQIVFDAIHNCDMSFNILVGHHSKVLSSGKSLISDILLKLVNSASHLMEGFNGNGSGTLSSKFQQFKKIFSDNNALYNSKYSLLIGSIDNSFETVKSAVKTFRKQQQFLMNKFSSLTIKNAAPAFRNIQSIVDGHIGTLDFALHTFSNRVPRTLLIETTNLVNEAHELQSIFKTFLKAVTPPIKQSIIQSVSEIFVKLAYIYETFLTNCYKFLIAATAYMSPVVAEAVSMVIMILEGSTGSYYKIVNSANNLIKLYTGHTVPLLSAVHMIEGIESLVAAVGNVVTLTPPLYAATADTMPAALENISAATENAFMLIISTYLTQVQVIPHVGVPLVSNVVDVLKAINEETTKLLSAIISISQSPKNKVATESIEINVRKIAVDIEDLTDAISKLTQNTVNNVQNTEQAVLTGFLREVLSSVLQIVYYVVFDIRRYLESIISGANIISKLSNIEKVLIAAVSQSTIQLQDFNLLLNNDVTSYKHMTSFVIASLNSTTGSLEKSFNSY